jgi:hypothetical protein
MLRRCRPFSWWLINLWNAGLLVVLIAQCTQVHQPSIHHQPVPRRVPTSISKYVSGSSRACLGRFHNVCLRSRGGADPDPNQGKSDEERNSPPLHTNPKKEGTDRDRLTEDDEKDTLHGRDERRSIAPQARRYASSGAGWDDAHHSRRQQQHHPSRSPSPSRSSWKRYSAHF